MDETVAAHLTQRQREAYEQSHAAYSAALIEETGLFLGSLGIAKDQVEIALDVVGKRADDVSLLDVRTAADHANALRLFVGYPAVAEEIQLQPVTSAEENPSVIDQQTPTSTELNLDDPDMAARASTVLSSFIKLPEGFAELSYGEMRQRIIDLFVHAASMPDIDARVKNKLSIRQNDLLRYIEENVTWTQIANERSQTSSAPYMGIKGFIQQLTVKSGTETIQAILAGQ